MKPVSNETILKQLQWRYATKKFDPTKKISAEDWKTLEQALLLSPSSFGLQPWKFVVVTDPQVRESLVAVSHGQRQVADASHLVIFTVRTDLGPDHVDAYIKRIAELRGTTAEALKGYRQMMVGSIAAMSAEKTLESWASRQVYIALGGFMAAAAMLGIDTCPMEGIEGPKYDELLGLDKQHCAALAICPAGYRSSDDKYANMPKVRFDAKDVIEHIA